MSTTVLGDCQAEHIAAGEGVPCPSAATGYLRGGCVHEHIREGWVCDYHRERQQGTVCRVCYNLGHVCPLLFEQVAEAEKYMRETQ